MSTLVLHVVHYVHTCIVVEVSLCVKMLPPCLGVVVDLTSFQILMSLWPLLTMKLASVPFLSSKQQLLVNLRSLGELIFPVCLCRINKYLFPDL